jgi:hypothetical protein
MIVLDELPEDINERFSDEEITYPRSPTSLKLLKSIAALPIGFRRLAWRGELSVPLIDLLSKVLQWIAVLASRNNDKGLSHPDQTFLLQCDPRQNAAIATRYSRRLGTPNSIERCICRCLVVLHANILNWSCRCTGYQRVLGELAAIIANRRLLQIDQGREDDEDEEFWSWVTLVTANAARRGAKPDLQAELISSFFTFSVQNVYWNYVKLTAKKYLWPEALSKDLEQCWRQGMHSITLLKEHELQEYPSHPFPPDLCAMISKFPEGFRELSLSCALRPSVIQLLNRVNDWIIDTSMEARNDSEVCRARHVSWCTELLVRENLNVAERMVCNGLVTPSMNMASINAVGKGRGDSVMWYKRLSELEAKKLSQLSVDDGLEKDCLMWVATALAASVEEGAAREDVRMKLFEDVFETCKEVQDWEVLRKHLMKFFWNEACEVEWHACWKDIMQRRLEGLDQKY